MTDPTVELSEKDELDWKIERSNEIAAICWKKCSDCNGRGYHRTMWVDEEAGGCDYVLKPTCETCESEGQIQLHDPWRVEALYDAADDARREMGVWCYTRIASALVLAVNEGVTLWERPSKNATVKSETAPDQFYTVTPQGCGCQDAYYRAPKINDIPHCEHQISVLLVKAAEHKMFEKEPRHFGPWSDALDGLISGEEADRREAK